MVHDKMTLATGFVSHRRAVGSPQCNGMKWITERLTENSFTSGDIKFSDLIIINIKAASSI